MKNQPNESQLAEQLRKINERMYSLERKMDLLAGLITPKFTEVKTVEFKPVQKVSQPSTSPINPASFAEENHKNYHSHQNNQNNRPKERMMYKTICADCNKECEVPFKPSGDRPIYCKDCFTLRKSRNNFKPKVEDRPMQAPKEVTAAPVVTSQAPVINKALTVKVKPKKKSAVVKKVAVKKKPAAKKSKIK